MEMRDCIKRKKNREEEEREGGKEMKPDRKRRIHEEIDAERNEGGEGGKRITLSRPQQRTQPL